MANQIDGNSWRFTGVTTKEEEEKLSGFHKIIGFFWVEGDEADRDIAANDVLEVTSGDGSPFYKEVAAGTPATASNAVRICPGPPGIPIEGFSVKQLTGGVLIVWTLPPYHM